MNIVITLDIPGDATEQLVNDLTAVLHAHGLDAAHTTIGSIHAVSCSMKPQEPQPEPDYSAAAEVEPTADIPAVVAMELPPELPPEPVEDPAPRVFGPSKILTLATNHLINAHYEGRKNTVLKVTGRILNDDIVRFTYNGFEHALPTADCRDQSIVNPTHDCGPSTVRLVVDISSRTYACLVDIEGGEGEALLIGDDLIHVVEEPAANVPRE